MNIPPILCIVGKSDSGKTTLIERLIPVLKQRGYRVGTIKHAAHGFELDREGKDSYRHRRAGASLVLIASPEEIGLIKSVKREYTFDELKKKFIDDVDIVLVEGFKSTSYPKIEVIKRGSKEESLCSEDKNLIALVAEEHHNLKVPLFNPDQIEELTDFIIERFLKNN